MQMHTNQEIRQLQAYWFKPGNSTEWSIPNDSKEEKIAQEAWRKLIKKELQIAHRELAQIRDAEGHGQYSRYLQRWIEESSALLQKISSRTPMHDSR
jgi:hypothetical protein